MKDKDKKDQCVDNLSNFNVTYPLCPNCWKTLILKFVIDGQNYYRCSGCGREDQ